MRRPTFSKNTVFSKIRAFGKDRRGAVALIGVASLASIVAISALAIDLGSVFLQSRQLQGVADLAAIGAANNLSNAQAAAQATASGNGWTSAVQATVVTGTYTADSTVQAQNRFSAGGAAPNAAKVTLSAQANLFFGQLILGRPTVTITRTATAASAQMAAFSIGSGLASLQGGVANSLLSALTGSSVSLSVMDYNALASANVDLLQYSQALQTKLNLTGASFNQVLGTQVSTGQALSVLSQLLAANNQLSAGAAINSVATAAGNAIPVDLQQLVDLGPYADQDHAEGGAGSGVSVNALQLASAILQLAQSGRQVQLSLGVSVPGLTSTSVWLAIGQRPSNSPWITVADDGSITVQTAQMRLYVVSQVGATGPLSLLGTSLTVPLFVQVASASAKLSSLNCNATGSTPAVTLLAQPSLGEVALGQVNTSNLNDFTQSVSISPAALISSPLATVSAQALVNIGGLNWQTVPFTQSDIQSAVSKTVSTNDIAQATAASLLPNANIQVQVLGLGLGLQGPLTAAVQPLLTAAAPSLDQVINSLTGLLGVQLGSATLQVDGLRCNAAALVA